MLLVSGFLIGFMVCFCVSRYADMVIKYAADACKGDCEKCTAHCVGYHCYVLRCKADTAVDELPASEREGPF